MPRRRGSLRRGRVEKERAGGLLTGSDVIRRNPDIAGRAIREGDGVLLLHTGTGAYYRLNRTGALIWGFLDAPIRRDELERRLREEFGTVSATLTEDLASHLADMAGLDLIHLEPQAAS